MPAYEQAIFDPRRIRTPIFRFLTQDGTIGGNANANGDYSVTPARFFVQPPPGILYILRRLFVSLKDQQKIVGDGWGANGSPLTNGISVNVRDGAGNLRADFLGGRTIKSNTDWGFLADGVQLISFGAGDQLFRARFEAAVSGSPIVLRGDLGENFGVDFSDDVSFIQATTFFCHGTTTAWTQ